MKRITALMVILTMLFTIATFIHTIPYAIASITAVVNNPNPQDRLNLRTNPSNNASSRGKYYNGVEVTILNYVNNDWVEVRIGETSGYAQGYMRTTYLAFGNDAYYVSSAIPTYRVTASDLELRASRASSSRSLGNYPRGTLVEVLGYGEEWHHVRVNGRIGFMYARYLEETSNRSNWSNSNNNSSNGYYLHYDTRIEDVILYRVSDDTIYSGDQSVRYNETSASLSSVKRSLDSGWGYVLYVGFSWNKTDYTKRLTNNSLRLISPGGQSYQKSFADRSRTGSLSYTNIEPTATDLLRMCYRDGNLVSGSYTFEVYVENQLFARGYVDFY
ncbi:hypothetical protein FACS1894184_04450 [Clostridia bacterium]|nr:hypothetical protein FACS1894184_04450 [Clostridia bacterium]